MTELLTEDEHKFIDLIGEAALLGKEICFPHYWSSCNDWNEMAQLIHALQNMVLAQAAARAYPEEYRLMGAD